MTRLIAVPFAVAGALACAGAYAATDHAMLIKGPFKTCKPAWKYDQVSGVIGAQS